MQARSVPLTKRPHGPSPRAPAWCAALPPRWRPALAFAMVLAAANLPLLSGRPALELVLLPGRVAAGEWWRLLTHPFVHASLYHLALDAAGFAWLWASLAPRPAWRRPVLAAAAAAGSAAGALLWAPEVAAIGLCGLSGAAHGLMAALGLELAASPEADRAGRVGGAICLAVVLAKALFETATGQVLFAGWHLGEVGTPVPACHLGGVLAGVAAWGALETTGRLATRGALRAAGREDPR